ncbi:MAG: (d)CMP kinase [Hyphomonadaceae bacterium]|nr:(d)CMP kinase [Hyphomonadaceae bacterium]MBC6412724.1 (d)CMP kinase [Hyphomonadaceae bacterium]
MSRPVIIAIDGTFASGKGTLAGKLADHYGFDHLDTGRLYRAVAQTVLTRGGDPDDAATATGAARTLDIALLDDPVLKSGPVGAAASRVAMHIPVRQALRDFQRDFATDTARKGAVLDGRDIGTVICPDADVKLYIDAKPEQRAQRRYAELTGYGEDITYESVLTQLRERDHRDSTRAVAPLKPAKDAHLIDTTGLSVDGVFGQAVRLVDAIMSGSRARRKPPGTGMRSTPDS